MFLFCVCPFLSLLSRPGRLSIISWGSHQLNHQLLLQAHCTRATFCSFVIFLLQLSINLFYKSKFSLYLWNCICPGHTVYGRDSNLHCNKTWRPWVLPHQCTKQLSSFTFGCRKENIFSCTFWLHHRALIIIYKNERVSKSLNCFQLFKCMSNIPVLHFRV